METIVNVMREKPRFKQKSNSPFYEALYSAGTDVLTSTSLVKVDFSRCLPDPFLKLGIAGKPELPAVCLYVGHISL